MNRSVIEAVEALQTRLETHNRAMYDHPETAFGEVWTSDHLCTWAEEEGFTVERGSGLLSTAFVATRCIGQGGPTIGFIAELDALEGLGHACGHNLISMMSFGGALALAKVAEEAGLDAQIRILGAPAEENGGGKIHMIAAGYFDDLDCAMMIHPGDKTMVEDFSFANQIFRYRFHGRTAHASAAPWEARDAVEGMLQTLNLINGLRHQMKDFSRVNPLIVRSGDANNVIPDFAEMQLNIRSADSEYLDELVEAVHRCAESGARAYGLELEIESIGLRYEAVTNSPVLEEIMARQFRNLGETVLPRSRVAGVGSTDMGNVTRHLPAIHGHLCLGADLKTHTIPFREATIGEAGSHVIRTGAAALALTGYELITQPGAIEALKQAFGLQGGRQ